MRGDAVQGGVLVALKMVVHPVLAWLVGTYVFALEHLPLAVAVMVAALPTGINVFILAERYERYVRCTATAVLVSTAFAILSQSALVALFADPK
jgi:predicted permease